MNIECYCKDITPNYLKHQQPYLFIFNCGDTEVGSPGPFRVAMATGHFDGWLQWYHFGIRHELWLLWQRHSHNFYFIQLILCSWGASLLAACEEAENCVSCIREELLGATRNGLSQPKEHFTSRNDSLSALIILGKEQSFLADVNGGGSIKGSKVSWIQIGQQGKPHISLVEYALLEVKNLPCLVWHSNSEKQGNGRDYRDQRKRRIFKNKKANKQQLKKKKPTN